MARFEPEARYHALFLCRRNSARSILAEAILNRAGGGDFTAHSAGADPAPSVHPRVIRLLENLGYNTWPLRPKSWRQFARPGAPPLDFIFPVCDVVAGEPCPAWPGQPLFTSWGIPDPVAADGSEAEVGLAFAQAYARLKHRIDLLLNLPLPSLDKMSLQAQVRDIHATAQREDLAAKPHPVD